ncbi:hypothetical protein GGR56DRAFT_646276 [Xylariaceae sp. FL0804]|nr:hypothetical protein GGR56DRAFT_646276 [Xylariaceae sp. FL0804]
MLGALAHLSSSAAPSASPAVGSPTSGSTVSPPALSPPPAAVTAANAEAALEKAARAAIQAYIEEKSVGVWRGSTAAAPTAMEEVAAYAEAVAKGVETGQAALRAGAGSHNDGDDGNNGNAGDDGDNGVNSVTGDDGIDGADGDDCDDDDNGDDGWDAPWRRRGGAEHRCAAGAQPVEASVPERRVPSGNHGDAQGGEEEEEAKKKKGVGVRDKRR